MPPPPPLPSSLPHGRTARRLGWEHLPPLVRAAVAERCGAAVVDDEPQTGGFLPGFSSVLTCADGSRHLVRAASTRAQRGYAHGCQLEARTRPSLPAGAPAAPLRWVLQEQDWVAVCIEHVPGRPPARPWTLEDATAVLDGLAGAAASLTPAPAALGVETAAEAFATWPDAWDHVRASEPDLPHLEEMAALAARFLDVCEGDTLVHTDVRDDTVLLADDGRLLLDDWHWPVRGAAWIDPVIALVGPRGDGLDADALLAACPVTAGVPAEHVDALLALLAGYYRQAADGPAVPAAPHLRTAQRWQARVCETWLRERRFQRS